MTLEIALLILVAAAVPIATGLWFPKALLRLFAPLWTYVPPIALTVHYMKVGPNDPPYSSTEAVLFPLMVFMFILIWPWIIWSRAAFRLLRERREGVRHEPPRFIGRL